MKGVDVMSNKKIYILTVAYNLYGKDSNTLIDVNTSIIAAYKSFKKAEKYALQQCKRCAEFYEIDKDDFTGEKNQNCTTYHVGYTDNGIFISYIIAEVELDLEL